MILVIKHVPNEGPGSIAGFFSGIRVIDLGSGCPLPEDTAGVSAVFIMGGPMNVYEKEKYPFLRDEGRFIKMLLEKDIPVFGICLGAQLLAEACGARVYRGPCKEIGWDKVSVADADSGLFRGTGKTMDVFQWHEDTFDLPKGAVLLAEGKRVKNQAFKAGRCAYGLQFHIEVTRDMIFDWFGKDASLYAFPDEGNFSRQAETIYSNFSEIIKG